MVTTVTIWDETLGYVTWDEALECAVFEFDAKFPKLGLDVAPLRMPLQEILGGQLSFSFPNLPNETYKGLPGLLADSLPDNYGNQLIDAWMARTGRDPLKVTPIERLCYLGSRGMGALEFKPALQRAADKSEALDMQELVSIASEILNNKMSLNTNMNADEESALKDIIRVGTSAGGARAKAIIAYNAQSGEVRSGQTMAPEGFSYWLLKFDGVNNAQLGDPKGYGRIEYAYHLMAKAMDIAMTECRLLEEHGRAHFMTKRFDRTTSGKKYHMQTLCGIAHFDYNNPNIYSYEQAFQVMRQLKLPYTDAEQLYRRMVFNVVARNCDDHTKNISFLMNPEGRWKLSPAYDVTYSYNPTSRWTSKHQMSVNGKRDEITRADLLEVARQMNIKHAKNIVDQSLDVVARWPEFAKTADMPADQIIAIAKMHCLDI